MLGLAFVVVLALILPSSIVEASVIIAATVGIIFIGDREYGDTVRGWFNRPVGGDSGSQARSNDRSEGQAD